VRQDARRLDSQDQRSLVATLVNLGRSLSEHSDRAAPASPGPEVRRMEAGGGRREACSRPGGGGG